MTFDSALQKLINLPIAKIGRAADLLWIQFGQLRETKSRFGSKTVGDWALHVQTAWRLVRNSRILVAVGDLYILPNGDQYDWESDSPSNFDVLAAQLNEQFSKGVFVQQVDCDDVGSFSLEFSNGDRFDVFPKVSNSVSDIEHWRLFQPGTDGEHAVCST